MSTNFASILDQKIGDIEAPALPPRGTYLFKITKHPEMGEAGQGKFQTIDFLCQAVSAVDDIDFPEGMKATDVKLRRRFMFNTDPSEKLNFDRSMNNLRTFLERHLQVDGAESMSIKEALAASVNHQFLGVVDWRADNVDPEKFYPEIARTAPTED